jgi:DNA repair ATPase RecN
VTVDEFRRHIVKATVGPGGAWHRADFHVHAPSSSDYEYREADASERLGQALARSDCGFAVVLKHQEFPSRAELDAIQPHCPRTKLIPGAEINVIVDALFKKIGRDYFFHCIVAVDPDGTGDYGYVLRKAQEELSYRSGEYPAGFRSTLLDVGKFFRGNGALFIPAHLHQSTDPETSRSVDDIYDDETFLGFIRDCAFDALEVRQVSTAAFFDGTRRTFAGLSIPLSVCVASSDAHHPDHVSARKRCTWVQAETKSFPELAAALSFPHRISLTEPISAHARVIGVHIVGSFVPESWIALNAGLNALIGSKGSGKTALLECLRFVLNTPVPSERVENVRRHIAHVLGSSGYVECMVQRADGAQMTIMRRADSPDRIVVSEKNGDTRVLGSSDAVPFPISILGWHEIEAVADKAGARIDLLDRIGDPHSVRKLYEEIGSNVERARDQLPLLQRQVKRLDSALREAWELRRKRATLKRLEQGDLLALQEQYEWYLLTEQKLDALRVAASRREPSVADGVKSRLSLDVETAPAPDTVGSAGPALTAVAEALRANEATEEDSINGLRAGLRGLEAAVESASKELAVSFATFRETVYAPKVNALPAEDREILSKQIQVLEETKRLPLVEKQCQEFMREVRSVAEELRALSDAICQIRENVVAGRERLVAGLNADLGSVRLRFLRSANQESRSRFQSRHGADGAALLGFVQAFGKAESYQNLRDLFDKLASLTLQQEQWDVSALLWDVRLLDLLDVFDDDDVEISLAVGKAGFVPLQNLSAGQRCVAVFPLLLRNTRGPLVVDQPEDNLDNRYIADVIAPDLLRRKQHQQFIVTSHNANLVVLTDADLVIHVDSDGATSRFPAAGFLSCSASGVRQSVLDVLDGGETALAARQRKYGSSNSQVASP